MRFIDLFCGAGGTTEGASQAGGEPTLAINHWERAIETHSANFPECRHLCQRIEHVDPEEFADLKIDLLFASPECTHHSNARGGKPRSEQSRASAWLVLRWLEAIRPKWLVVENVTEFEDWGPLTRKNKPDKTRIGYTFRAWMYAFVSLGYHVEHRVLNAADYGDGTDRRRLFVIGSRDGRNIPWPGYRLDMERTAISSFLDRSLPTRDISKKPLCINTMNRIEAGRKKFGDAPWVLKYYGSGGWSSVDKPLPTITTRDRFALIQGDQYRMFHPEELKQAQGFPPDYRLAGTREEKIKQIGNSVCPGVARAITRSLMSL